MTAMHAAAAPSALARIVQCEGSLLACLPFKDAPPEPHALEGQAAHWVAAEYAQGKNLFVDRTETPQGLTVDEDMIRGAILWRDSIGRYGVVEQPVPVQPIHETQCWGTPDWWRWDPIEYVLNLFDYKYGHLYVEVWDSWQLIAYAAGIMDMLGLSDTEVTLSLNIVQPRCYTADGKQVRQWRIPAPEIRSQVKIARDAVARALRPGASFQTGPECDYCPARHTCQTLRKAGGRVVDYTSSNDPVSLDPIGVGLELRYLKDAMRILEARFTGLEAQAMAMLRSGKQVPYWRVGHGNGKTKWLPDVAYNDLAVIGDMAGVDLRKPLALITPTQASDAGFPAALLSEYSKRIPGATRLEPDSALSIRKLLQQAKVS